MDSNAPRWNLSSIYDSFDSKEYGRDCRLLEERIEDLQARIGELTGNFTADTLLSLIKAWEEAGEYAENLGAYAEAIYTADTRDERARAEINRIETLKLPLGKAAVLFRRTLESKKEQVMSLTDADSRIEPYSFFLSEAITRAAFQMDSELEDLANDLCRSGGDAWARLHGTLASTASTLWDAGSGERKTVTELRSLANSSDRELRRRAYEAELEAWKAVEIPMAAALNGVKGFAITVDRRRGWKNPLGKSAFQSRINEKTLAALISAIENSLPLFRRYLKAKARLLGIEKCAFFDLFAPLGYEEEGVEAARRSAFTKRLSWDEACALVADCFGRFDPAMAAFARKAYASGWVDAEMRDGKVGGAYCTDFPLAKEARILCNFDGSFDSALTLAHETGHAWHHELIKNLPRALSRYPMTLAETASIFAETLVFEAALKDAPPSERLALIEGSVKDSCQTLVDILSRYYFEKELFSRRESRELPAAELCGMMLDAQEKTYGDALDREKLHPYMWAVKAHYYSPALPFYNYPYAFGQLFALSLYARGREDGGFAGAYRGLLAATGRCSAEDLALKAGFDISDPGFWTRGIGVIEDRILAVEGGLHGNG
ncbi:MAG: M3 family oligoendopeptidase [Spirochaetaceae bacterium]|jgi:pepF/M3 family oligoendopeptidase|nr:M3 family oligoendopeptidase [Spirochaetaceae bacterium]